MGYTLHHERLPQPLRVEGSGEAAGRADELLAEARRLRPEHPHTVRVIPDHGDRFELRGMRDGRALATVHDARGPRDLGYHRTTRRAWEAAHAAGSGRTSEG